MDKYDIINQFWTEKIKNYCIEYNVYDSMAGITDSSYDIKNIYETLVSKYGDETIKLKSWNDIFSKTPISKWELTMVLDKSENSENSLYLSNQKVSNRDTISFLLSFSHGKKNWAHSYKRREIIELFSKVYDDYEDNKNQLNSQLQEIVKKEKIEAISQQSIRTIVESKMSGSNYKWNLVQEKTRMLLQIKMKKNKMIEISLGYKTFTNKIPDLMEVITQMESILEMVPYPVDIRNCKRNIDWKG